MHIRSTALGSALSLALALPLAAEAAVPAPYTTVEGISEYRLANGLRVLIAPDASKPTTTVNVTYLVGSRHEGYGETGMAHLLEHMLFKGTSTRDNILSELGRRGMEFNGTTFFDRTNYYETFPAGDDNLRWALEMEADRMINSRVDRKDLDTEFSVVRNEMEMGENDPRGVLWKQLSAVSFDWHNYGHSTIGARSDVEGVKVENLRAFYQKYYQPDNAVLMIAGKFDPATTVEQVSRIFGGLPKPVRKLERTWTREAPRDGMREITIRRSGDTYLAAVLYPTSAGSHSDGAPLNILSEVLANTPNGRLHKALIEGRKAVSVEYWGFDLAEPGYIMFLVELNKQQKLAEARQILINTVEGVKQTPVTDEEVKRAKANVLNLYDRVVNDPQKLCVAMSESIAQGDWRLFFLTRDRFETVTTADVQRVALNYFKENNRSFGQFVPSVVIDRTVIPETPDVEKLVEGYKGRAAVAEGEAFDVSPANIEKRTERVRLANGARMALLSKKTRGETIHGTITLNFGDVQSLSKQAWVARLTASMLHRGTGKLSRADISSRLDELKSKLSIQGSGQQTNVRFETSKRNLPAMLALVRDLLRAPSFPEGEFELLKKAAITGIEAQRNEPETVASVALEKATSPYKKDDVRYVGSFDEDFAGVSAVTLHDIRRFHTSFYGADNAQVAIVGDFNNKDVKAQLQTLFGDWKSKAKYRRLVSEPPLVKTLTKQLETPDKASAIFIASSGVGVQDTSPDYTALLAANQVLGAGPKSRLFERLRQKDGISYDVGSQLSVSSFEPVGTMQVYAIYAPGNLRRLQTGLKEEFERFVRDGITKEELEDAKKSLLEERRVNRAQDGTLARGLANQEHVGRTMTFSADQDTAIARLTVEDVNNALHSLIDPGKFTYIYAGDFSGAGKEPAGR